VANLVKLGSQVLFTRFTPRPGRSPDSGPLPVAGKQENLGWLEEHEIPIFPCPEKVVKALAALYRPSSVPSMGNGDRGLSGQE